MHQITKGKFLPIITAVLFVGSTIFFSTAAAQKIMRSGQPGQGQTTDIIKTTKAASGNFLPSSEIQAGDDSQAGTAENSVQNQVSVQSGSSGEAGDSPEANTQALTGSAKKNAQNSQGDSVQDIQNQGVNQNNTQNNQGSSSTATVANSFTLATLAVHNKTGDCYIAYKGKVYNLSNSAAWANCQHHGAKGGIDVTAIFPHPASYFETLPLAGVLVAGNAQNNIQNNQSQNTAQNSQKTSSTAAPGNTSTGLETQGATKIWREEDEGEDDAFEYEQRPARQASQTQIQRSSQNLEQQREDD